MPGGALDMDRIVALVGVVLCMVLVGRSVRLRSLPRRRRFVLGAVWAAIFGVVAGVADLLSRGSP